MGESTKASSKMTLSTDLVILHSAMALNTPDHFIETNNMDSLCTQKRARRDFSCGLMAQRLNHLSQLRFWRLSATSKWLLAWAILVY